MVRQHLNVKTFVAISSGLILFDVLSLAAYTFPLLSWVLLPIFVVALAIIAIRSLPSLLAVALAELLWTSFGSSFAWDIGPFHLTLRMLIFAMSIGMWTYHRYLAKTITLSMSRNEIIVYGLLILAVVWGGIIGLVRGNALGTLFLDVNAYFFLIYYPIIRSILDEETLQKALSIVIAVACMLAVKTLVLFNLFASQYAFANVQYVYLWIRDTRVGEITLVSEPIWRIFMQSQLYCAIVWLWYVISFFSDRSKGHSHMFNISFILLSSALLVSFSRSYWVGMSVALMVLIILSIVDLVRRWRFVMQRLMMFAVMLLCSGVLVIVLAYVSTLQFIVKPDVWTGRISAADAAGISRVQMLKPLLATASSHVLVGSGFGMTVTYFSSDPRIKSVANPTGQVTTYAFEWGYLEQIIKLGSIAFAVWYASIAVQMLMGWRMLRKEVGQSELVVCMLSGMVLVLSVHMFSPYLNHPLGLGYLMIVMAVLHYVADQTYVKTHH